MPEAWRALEAAKHNERRGTKVVIVKTSILPAGIPIATYYNEILPEVGPRDAKYRIFDKDGPDCYIRNELLEKMRGILMTGKTPEGIIMMVQADENLAQNEGTCLTRFDFAKKAIESGAYAEEIGEMILPVAIVSPYAHARMPGGMVNTREQKTLVEGLKTRGIPILRTTPEMRNLQKYIEDLRRFFNNLARGVTENML